MLKVEGIYKKYGKKQVLKNLSFVVPEGSIYTLVGAFGEGKTTLLNIIAGYDKADRGNVYIKDVECQTKPTKAKELFGFVPDNFPMYEELSGKEYLEFFGTIMSQKDEVWSRLNTTRHCLPTVSLPLPAWAFLSCCCSPP